MEKITYQETHRAQVSHWWRQGRQGINDAVLSKHAMPITRLVRPALAAHVKDNPSKEKGTNGRQSPRDKVNALFQKIFSGKSTTDANRGFAEDLSLFAVPSPEQAPVKIVDQAVCEPTNANEKAERV